MFTNMSNEGRDRLLARAVKSHVEYVAETKRLRLERQEAFRAANEAAISQQEIADCTGLSRSYVSGIMLGKY